MRRLKNQDWSNMTNRDIVEVISKMKPRLWFRLWMRLQGFLFKHSKRYRYYHLMHYSTKAPEPEPSRPLTMDDIRKHLKDCSR